MSGLGAGQTGRAAQELAGDFTTELGGATLGIMYSMLGGRG
jgi:hypothetical protein